MLAPGPEWRRPILRNAVPWSHGRAVDSADSACGAVGLFAGEEKIEAYPLAEHLFDAEVRAESSNGPRSDRVTSSKRQALS